MKMSNRIRYASHATKVAVRHIDRAIEKSGLEGTGFNDSINNLVCLICAYRRSEALASRLAYAKAARAMGYDVPRWMF